MKTTFEDYGEQFQLEVVKLFISDFSFAQKIKDIINEDYFDNKFVKWVIKTTITHLTTYRALPSWNTLRQYVNQEFTNPTTQKLYLSVLTSIEESSLQERAFVASKSIDFCFRHSAVKELTESLLLIDKGEYETARLKSRNAFKTLDTVIDDFDLKRDWRQIFSVDAHVAQPTLFKTFNLKSKGGPSKGDLAVAVASSNFGKTAFLTGQARYLNQQGRKVAYFSLETRTTQIAQRYIAGMMEINQEDLIDHQAKVEKKIDSLHETVRFFKFKANSVTVSTIIGVIEDLIAEGFYPDDIMIDYIQLIKIEKGVNVKGDNEKIEYIATCLREDLAHAFNVLVWTAQQTNRDGFDTLVPDIKMISRAIESYWIADFFIIFSQQSIDKEEKIAYVTLMKNRHGEKDITLKIYYDPNRGTFEELEVVSKLALLNTSQKGQVQKGLGVAQEFMVKRQLEFEDKRSRGRM